jgi:translation initiation factor IF-3
MLISAGNDTKFLANQVFPALKFASRGVGQAGSGLSAPRLFFLEEDSGIAATKRVRRNDEIDATEVRLIGSSGDQRGVMSLSEALGIARDEGLDLVEVSPNAEPPVCRIMDFGKYLFEQNKKAQLAKRKQKQVHVKEIKFRPGTEEGDYQVKLRKLTEFLEQGDKTKVTLRFRGREMAHKELGAQLLARVRNDLEELCVVEQMPQMEGRQMIMVLAPKKK